MSDDGETRDDAPEEETVVPAEPDDDEPEDFSPFDEVYDDFLAEPLPKIIGDDGLPEHVDTGTKSHLPPLSPKTLVCMGVFTKFVLRDSWREIVAEFEPSEVDHAPNGKWRVPLELARERLDLAIALKRTEAGAAEIAMVAERRSIGWIEVEPLRPPCKHYVRQFTQFELNPENDAALRLCAARRTTEGAFMSVRDRRFEACDMREPRDLDSEKILDDFDAKKIREGDRREYFSIFDGYEPGKPDATTTITYERGTP